MARPSSRTETIIERIETGFRNGLHLGGICSPDDMPNRTTVWRWEGQDVELCNRLARARQAGAAALVEQADNLLAAATRDDIQVIRERVHHLRWRAARLDPGKFGDKTQVAISGEVGHIHKLSDDAPAWLRERLAAPVGALIEHDLGPDDDQDDAGPPVEIFRC